MYTISCKLNQEGKLILSQEKHYLFWQIVILIKSLFLYLKK